MSVKGSRYGQAGKLIKEAQEYDFSSDDKLVSSVKSSWACARKWDVIKAVFSRL